MITALLIIVTLLAPVFIKVRILPRKHKCREQRRRQKLELENTEYDYGHDVCHDETEY